MTHDKGCLFSLKKTGELTAVCYSPKGVREKIQPVSSHRGTEKRQETRNTGCNKWTSYGT